MHGYVALLLHAHLPFVRHPEEERFLEENWLFEATLETYLPLIQILDGWLRDGIEARISLTLSPTLCSMLRDPLLQDRFLRHLEVLIELAEREIFRNHFDPELRLLAQRYLERFRRTREIYLAYGRDLVGAFRKFQEVGLIEIVTTAATHAVLPLFREHRSAQRAQVLVAKDDYRACFGRDPRGFWLPECAYDEGLEKLLSEAGMRWFVLEAHGLLHAQPCPAAGTYAPVLTPSGVAAFGRDEESARQVWSRHEGYPGDSRYRDFYRDIGFDLDYDYVKAAMPAPGQRTFTGIKYYAISRGGEKLPYDVAAARLAVAEHAMHFVEARRRQIQQVSSQLKNPPVVMCPYDAELFGHWWYEGPEFVDLVVRSLVQFRSELTLITPEAYLERHPSHPVVCPSASTWGEEGYLKVWLNESNEWIYPHLDIAQRRMTELTARLTDPDPLTLRALRQAGRELLLAQSSDWPFILRSSTSPEYARRRVRDHLIRFQQLYKQLISARVDKTWLREIEARDNLFPEIEPRYWRENLSID